MKKAVIAFAGFVAAASVASASTSFVGSRGALAGTDFIDWGQFGSTYTPVNNPSPGMTANSMPFVLSTYSVGLERRDQGAGWGGNFAGGDRLMWNASSGPGAIRIDFANPVNAVGAQIQNDFFGGFVGMINVFDSGNVNIGSFSLGGNSTSAGDNSAIFLGVLSTAYDIAAVEFNVSDNSGALSNSFAINQVDLNSSGHIVPLPTGAGLAFAGMGILGFRRNRR